LQTWSSVFSIFIISLDPRLYITTPLVSIIIGNVKNTCSRYSSRSSVLQVSNLENKSHIWFDRNTFIVS
jgi:hypothetical protein